MPLFVLDTDHVSLLQREHPRVAERFKTTPEETLGVSIVTYEEQLRGRLAVIRQAAHPPRLAVAYARLREMQRFFCAIRLLDFDAPAMAIYTVLRQQQSRVGVLDLRIAATALAAGGTLVTRNTRDFASISNLLLEDWSIG